MELIKIEFKKIYKEKSIFILYLLLLIIFLLPFFRGEQSNDFHINFLENNLMMSKAAEDAIKNEKGSETLLEDIKESNMYLEELIQSIKSNDKKRELFYELKYEKKNLEDMESGNLFGGSIIEQKAKVKQLNNLYLNKIEKINYDIGPIKSINYLHRLMNSKQSTMLLFIIISLGISNYLTMDRRKKNIELLIISPISNNRIDATKLTCSILFTTFNVSILLFLSFIIPTIKSGVGNMNYPVSYIVNNDTIKIMSVTQFIMKYYIFLIIWIIFLSCLSLLISKIVSSFIINSFLLLIMTNIAQYNLFSSLIPENIKPYLLSTYINISTIILGSDGFQVINSNSINMTKGITLLLIASFFISIIIFVKNNLILR